MRTAFHAALASLVAVVPAAAQAGGAGKPTTRHKSRKAESHETFVAVLSGAYEVPPVTTNASGTAELTVAGSRVHYRVHADSVGEITGVYLHIGRAGEERPAVADLFEGLKEAPTSELVASGTLRAKDLHGTTLAKVIRALRENDAYVTLHTRMHPGGELRGQVRIQPVVASR